MHKYTSEPKIQEKLLQMLKVQGPVKTIKFALMKGLLPINKIFLSDGKFKYEGKDLKYFLHNYNNTWDNERGVEVAIFENLLKDWLFQNKSILEVGHVIGHYFDNNGKWEVLDKFEKANGVINKDIADFNPGKKYDYIFSISTMEHVGFDDDQVEPDKVDGGIENIKSLLCENGVFIMSDPLGYNKTFDKKILENKYGFQKMVYLKRIGYRHWFQVERSEVENCVYDSPFNAANALAICYYYNNGKKYER